MSKLENGKYKLILKYPASWWRNMWREGLPTGNGRIGVSVYGAIQEETLLINHERLWHWGYKDTLPDVSHTLPKARDLIDQGNFSDASWLLADTLKESGYQTRLASVLPLAAVKILMPSREAFRHYRRSVNMETGEVAVTWKEGTTAFERNCFVSRADDVIVYEIKSNDEQISGDIRMMLHQTDNPSLTSQIKELEETVEIKAEKDFLFYAATNDDKSDFGAVLRIQTEGGDHYADSDGKGIHIRSCRRVFVLIKVFTHSERNKEWSGLQKELSSMTGNYGHFLEAHAAEHQRLFHSASLELGDVHDSRTNEELLLDAYEGEAPTSLIEKMWSFGRYLFLSGTHKDGLPFGMYGRWGGDYRLMWCHNMANENIQMMYWHAPVGGFSELMPPMFQYYNNLMDDFKDNAMKLYGCRGVYIPAGSSPGIGVPNQVVPVIMNWTGAAGWLARHYYEYYLFTGDTEFLKQTVLPFMKETALFYEDFLVLGDDGYYQYYPSVSPENTPQNFMPKDGKPLAHPMPTTINATMDFAIMKELLTHLVEGSKAIGLFTEEIDKWNTMLARIPGYQINEDGAISEWMHPAFDDRYEHRHLSHIYPIFPGQEIIREDEPELFGAFESAVMKRLISAQSGWSLTHMACIYARLGNGEKALECLDILSRSCLLNNFMTLHNDWRNMGICMNEKTAPIQLDANMGWVHAIQEMLLYVSPPIVKILPALPGKWKTGKVTDWRFCTGKVSFTWDLNNRSFSCVVYAERETAITVVLPKLFGQYSFGGDWESMVPNPSYKGGYDIKLSPGQCIEINA